MPSRYDQSWSRINKPTKHKNLSWFKRRFGAQWKGPRFSLRDMDFDALANWLTAIVMVLLLLVTWAYMNARDARLDAELSAEQSTKSFAHFLSGGILTNPEQTVAVKCLQVLDVTN